MIRNTLLFTVGMLLSNIGFAQKSMHAKAILKEVTVFNNGAEMNHLANLTLPLGTSEIVFTHVANNLDENSIQIGATANVTVLSVRPALNYLDTDVKTAEYNKVEGHYKQALSKLNSLNNEKATEESMLKLLEQNQRIAGQNTSTTVAELMKMTEFYGPKYLAVKNKITDLTEKIEIQQDLVNKANVQFNEVKGQTTGSGGQLIVQVLTTQAGNQNFQLSYLARQAGWNASYELRSTDTKSPLQIVYKANIVQQTGVDWEQVNLRLSTSNPTQGGTAPVLTPWHLYYYSPERLMVRGNAGAPNSIMEEVTITAAGQKKMAMSKTKSLGNYVQQNENQLNTTFDVAIPYTIASNGRQHSVSLIEYAHKANYQYFVAPRIDQDVFLMAELTAYESLNLVPGEANVLFDNMLVGKTYIDPNVSSDTLKLSLGRDKMLSVKREKLNDLSQTKIFGSSKRQSLVYETTIKNNKKSAVDITVQEQIPISTDKAMEINLEEADGASIDKETGIVTWNINIPAGSSKKIKFGYSIKYPKDKQVSIY